MQYLHVHSMYSKGDSTVRPESVVQKIQELGGRSVTLTDHGTLMGIDPFMAAGKKYGINTIPGVEAYGENRTHLILVPKNYKGFQAISYAMRDANEHIEKVRNLTYPIMLDSILTEYFQDNTDVIATSACIQGPISYILLANHRIKSKAAKAQNLYDSTLPAYERYTEAAQTVKDLKNEISSLKKQRTADSKPLKPAFQNTFKSHFRSGVCSQVNTNGREACPDGGSGDLRKGILTVRSERNCQRDESRGIQTCESQKGTGRAVCIV